jgi:hypothetical protein
MRLAIRMLLSVGQGPRGLIVLIGLVVVLVWATIRQPACY